MKQKIIQKIKRFLFFKKYKCSVCDDIVDNYLPLDSKFKQNSESAGYKYFGQNEHLSIKKYNCPKCKSSDRDRLYAAYYSGLINLKENNKGKLLHIAPSWPLNNFFLVKNFSVITTDLMMVGVDYLQDVENMKSFEDDFFDFVLCSHVLEHVNNPKKALSEIKRVLKKNGEAILMAPINPNIKSTLENPKHVTPEERLRNYGQEDHLRLFAKNDFISLIKSVDFELKTIDIKDLGKSKFDELGLNPNSVLYIGIKK